jgi:capsular polysaccharide biosynthesis protein
MNNGDGRPSERREDRPQGPWLDDPSSPAPGAELGTGLLGFPFIRSALGRSRRLWGGLGVIGLLLGIALSLTPAPAHASTTLVLDVGPEPGPGTGILNDQAIAQSQAVADLALKDLGLTESIDGFRSTYIASVVTDQVLRIDLSAATPEQAVRRADAVSRAFLRFRTDELQILQDLQFEKFDQELLVARQRLDAANGKVAEMAAQVTTGRERNQLRQLEKDSQAAKDDLAALEKQVTEAKAEALKTKAEMVAQSRVLDAASVTPEKSRAKTGLLYAAAGLVGGLALGICAAIARALVSDRLRERNDVAFALGAPVGLSVRGKPRRIRRRGPKGRDATRKHDIQRVVSFLDDTVVSHYRGEGFAVVPVDDTRAGALSLVSLALSYARRDKRVVLADLCRGAPAARLLGIRQPGVHTVTVGGAELVVDVPDPHEVAPVGPFGVASQSGHHPATPEVIDASASADLVLVLVTLDPSTGSDYLATWAAEAVVTVTAGRSSATKIQATGELVRLAGTRLVSAVLLGADKWDETLGVSTPTTSGRGTAEATPLGAAPALRTPAHARPEERSASG